MTVFNTAFKIVKKYKFVIILYTVLLSVFTYTNFSTNDNNTSFTEEKPDIVIVNKDKKEGITKELINYLEKNSNIVKLDEDKIDDSLFYRDIDYVIYIPNNYRNDAFTSNIKFDIKTNDTYLSSLSEMTLNKFINTFNIYKENGYTKDQIINNTNKSLEQDTKIVKQSKLDTTKLSQATFYYNFLNYSMLAGSVYVISLVLFSFKEEKIRKRTNISSTNYKKINRQLLLSTGIISSVLWIIYVLISFILIPDVMTTNHGLIYIFNSLVFNICSITIAFLISNLVSNKGAINGIINVVALGSSFLCGAFVSVEFLPESVLKVAHILPSYWYIHNNEIIKKIEIKNINNTKEILTNSLIILLFAILYIIITNIITKKKQKIK